MWFVEAYWKIGTLYLDRKEYLKGAFEITRAREVLGGHRDIKNYIKANIV
ncbi:MAG: hypothetical protein JW822_09905 [Spirochaetales bacterium]|nr:hypothetical protein [Spirochaetales bacterium]